MIITPLFIVFNIFVFVLVWFFVKTIDERKWLNILVSLVLTPVVYFYIFYPFVNIFASYHHQKYFNETTWKTKAALRYEMSDDLINKKFLIGKTKQEVQSVLGETEWLGWDDNKKEHTNSIWNYNLGIEPGAFNDMQECLKLTFENEKVIAIEQYQIEVKFE